MVGMKFWYAIGIFVALVVAIAVYGIFAGGIPGIPQINTRTVTVHTQVDALVLCMAQDIRITGVTINNDICTTEAGDSGGDVTISATEVGEVNPVAVVTKRSCCGGCDVNSCWWGCGGAKSQQTTLCLLPGTYKIKAWWYDPLGYERAAERTITVE